MVHRLNFSPGGGIGGTSGTEFLHATGNVTLIAAQQPGRHDALEKELRLHVKEDHAKGLQVSCEDIQTKAWQLVQRGGIGQSTKHPMMTAFPTLLTKIRLREIFFCRRSQ